jgi:hypothetical protein
MKSEQVNQEQEEESDRDFSASENGYVANILDANEPVFWRDVVQVKQSVLNANDISCPICLEPLSNMVCPRITKCGHVYCWTCVLQYLEFEKQRNWKRCALCFDCVYKLDLKPVIIEEIKTFKTNE